MKIEFSTKDNYVIAKISEAITLYNAEQTKNDLEQSVERNEKKNLVIDLKETPYLDSSGIVALHKLQKTLEAKDLILYLIQINASILAALKLSGLNVQFNILENYEQLPG
ncbi:STAS domain-containing protein [Leptospira sp. GIMC2001]|uniref:STAS domain-containing protein n=1 Tax=Leptospira sp. GIMC2001 TaxID=1513297 RepID=UPI0023498F05|nr:STAS domain-containing protein [Leptospira sp. GIMC2001]WCL49037.1 STAS domain-containing protein [Leptospira sp. GIMC2001]